MDGQQSGRNIVCPPSAVNRRLPIVSFLSSVVYGVQWKISAGRMLKNWKLSLTELKLDSR